MAGLLKYNYSELKEDAKGLIDSINELRDKLKSEFESNSDLESYYRENFAKVYAELPLERFPASAPFSFDDVLNPVYKEISSKKNLKEVISGLLQYNYQKPEDKETAEALIDSINELRDKLKSEFESNSDLKSYYENNFAKVYSEARELVSKEPGFSLDTFPEYKSADFSFKEVLDENYPEISSGKGVDEE